MINLKKLITKLNPVCQKALEAAAGICISNNHHYVDIEHWFLKLCEEKHSDINIILAHYQIDKAYLLTTLSNSLSHVKAGNVQTPALSQRLIDLIRSALLIANLEYSASKIRSAFLLYALLNENNASCLLGDFYEVLSGIALEKFRVELMELIKNSAESETIIVEGFTPVKSSTLDQYTVNLTALAAAGKIDPVIGRETEIQQLIDILMRRRQNNPILTGEPGVGKTAVVEGFALRVAQKQAPPALVNVAVHALDLGLLQAGSGIKGEFENRLMSVIQAVKNAVHPIILFIDEAHTLIGAGAQAGQGDAANLLKPVLARGELRTIAATTWAEYKKYFEQDAALARRFQVIKIEEPTEDVAVNMLQGLVKALEKHHGVVILDEAIVAAVSFSHRYIAHRQLPDKAISVLDTACARLAIRMATDPSYITDRATSGRENSALENSVNTQAIAEVVASWTGIPLGRMVQKEVHTVLQLEQELQKRIIGQSEALKTIAQSIHTARAQLADPGKPIGIFLLVGPSGVGKTETAMALAEILYGGIQSMTVINLSEFKEVHKVSMLLGAPPGYVGYGEGGVLTEAVRQRPYSLILLDELEKAHASVQDVFYQVFDKGTLKDGQGRDINFKNTIIILTSNVGGDEIQRLCADPHNIPDMISLKAVLQPALSTIFKPAFLGRVTVVPYLPLSDQLMQRISELQLQRIQTRVLKNYEAQLTYDHSVLKHIVARCREVQTGARNIDHVLTHSLLPELSAHFLTHIAEGKKIAAAHVGVNGEGFSVTCQS